jgi:DNA-binding PadR family transcriptional regulator
MIQNHSLIITKTIPRILPPKSEAKVPAGVLAILELMQQGHTAAKAMQILERKSGHIGKVPEAQRAAPPEPDKPRRPNIKTTSARSIILGMLGDTPEKIGKPLAFAAGLSVDTIYRAISDLKAVGHIASGPYDNGKPTYLLTEAGRIERQRRLGDGPSPLMYVAPVDARTVVLSIASETFATIDHALIEAAGVSQTAGYNAVSNMIKSGQLERGARIGSVYTYRLTDAGKIERARRCAE